MVLYYAYISAGLSWCPIPTLAERQREELSKRLPSFGIKLADSDNSSSPREEKSAPAPPPAPLPTRAEKPKEKEKSEGMQFLNAQWKTVSPMDDDI